MKSHFRTVIEPFVIKSIEPLKLTTREERKTTIRENHYNLFKVNLNYVLCCQRSNLINKL